MELPDQQQRELALVPAQSFIVQAPAGSGKTTLLVMRYLTLLATAVKYPEEIIAITFTRKAAAEMRERVIAALTKAELNQPGVDPVTKLATKVIKRSQQFNWQLILNPARLRITTIDSLCSSIVGQMPLSSGVTLQAKLLEGVTATEVYKLAAKNLLTSLAQTSSYQQLLRNLLLHLDNDWSRAEQLLAAMLTKREQWLPHLVTYRSHPKQLRKILENTLQELVTQALADCHSLWPKSSLAELIDIMQQLGIIGPDNFPENTSFPCLINSEDDVRKNNQIWKAIANFCLTKTGTWRKKFTTKQGFIASKNNTEKEFYIKLRTQLQQLLRSLADNNDLRTSLQQILLLPATVYEEKSWELIAALTQLLVILAAELEIVFKQQNALDYTEIALAAENALGQIGNPSEIALRLDYKLQHLLVDEFQDTSVTQYRILEKLTAGWETGDGKTLFLVGDPMQSIYKFREAKVGLFLKAKQEGINSIKLTPITLQTNFRSHPQLVNWINNSCEQIFPQADDITNGAISYSPMTAGQIFTTPGQIKCYSVHAGDYQTEANQVLQIVRRTWGNKPTASIAILVRYKTHLSDIISVLQLAKLPYQAIELEPLAAKPVIRDLFTLTRAILDHDDRIAWLALLRAPWGGLTVSELHIVANFDPELTIWDSIQALLDSAKLKLPLHERLQKIVAIVKNSLDKIGKISLRLVIEELWLALGGPAITTNTTVTDDAKNYLKLLAELEVANKLPDISILEQQLEDLYASSNETQNSIQLLSIHKAKGLEFDVVILPGLNRKPRQPDQKLLQWMEIVASGKKESQLLLALIHNTQTVNQLYNYLNYLEAIKNRYELQRLLYVALTRAKTELHLLAVGDKVNKGSCFELLYPHWSSPQLLESTAASNIAPQQVLLEQLPLEALNTKLTPLPRIDTSDCEYYQQEILARQNVGIVIHDWLAKLTQRIDISNHLIEKSKLKLQQLGTYTNLAALVEEINRAVTNTLSDPRGQWILAQRPIAYSEYPITYNDDGIIKHYIIDRLFVDDGNCWIVDYKTTTDSSLRAEYITQLKNYARAVTNLITYPIKLAIYQPMLSEWHEL